VERKTEAMLESMRSMKVAPLKVAPLKLALLVVLVVAEAIKRRRRDGWRRAE
jgi:hypothetical protein